MPKATYDGVEIEVSEPMLIPINWVTFRCHPATDWTGVEMYKSGELPGAPIIICKSCWTLLDGWHRLAAAWQLNCRYIQVRFTDFHLGGAPTEYLQPSG